MEWLCHTTCVFTMLNRLFLLDRRVPCKGQSVRLRRCSVRWAQTLCHKVAISCEKSHKSQEKSQDYNTSRRKVHRCPQTLVSKLGETWEAPTMVHTQSEVSHAWLVIKIQESYRDMLKLRHYQWCNLPLELANLAKFPSLFKARGA